jgi:tRNA-2-methylthio-N6-dimethylallyladenosine synthase
MNTADSQRLGSELERRGYAWVERPEDADVVVLNTCVVRQQAEDKVYGRLGSLRPVKAARPDMVIGLMGCLVGHKVPASLRARFPEVDVFIPPSGVSPLLDVLDARALEDAAEQAEQQLTAQRWQLQDAQAGPGSILLPDHERGQLISAHVPVIHGCSWVCTFCIIPSRRGPERSRDEAEIVTHVRSLVEQGVREVTLLGQIVDRYGFDRGEKDGLARLLRRLDGIDGLARIRFLTSHPNFMTDELLDTVAELPKVMEHIEVPFQAGDDEVLRRMKRGYSVEEYRSLVERIRSRIPDPAIHTDIIVGFCGETEAQFQSTYDLLAELRLDKAHIARFSTRPGTVAAKTMVDDVPEEEKERRRLALDELQATISGEINRDHVGREVEVLVESKQRDRWRARTRTNKLVFFEDPRNLLGQLVPVAIDWAGPWSMVGHATDRPAQATREVIALEVL